MQSKCENLLQSSQIPADASNTDTRIQDIFNFLFDTIQAGGTTSRLAYYRLYGYFETLENLIQAERKQGFHDGKKTASVAIDTVRGHRPNGTIQPNVASSKLLQTRLLPSYTPQSKLQHAVQLGRPIRPYAFLIHIPEQPVDVFSCC
ncbi:uncharacterized protein F4822DRAFT_150779 [Hypoxylon trugodes]|uniref:uncharacterized protein n=1 Tax=Hypoxylon trugodes TaxID=326681 RepID=UPI00218ED81E|nr:uncharacterized protein F4822DRAFT_150779 [Hypoxylon trugodes]KAI1382542.1 hypothetical protein F4822DRAFT_150779 [Hypoxylon trugodes]